MKRKCVNALTLTMAMAVLSMTMMGGCSKEDDNTTDETKNETVASETEADNDSSEIAVEDTSAASGTSGREDGERFEETIMIEGMEETVYYEHYVDTTIGFEIDYEYYELGRSASNEDVTFFSMYDDPNDLENYLEITYSPDDADLTASNLTSEYSSNFEVIQSSVTLDNGVTCTKLSLLNPEDGSRNLQNIYVIPADDGCRVASAHFTIESSEGFGTRFDNTVRSINVIAREA